MNSLKLYCIVAKDSLPKMKGNRGKLAAMAGHAYLHAWWESFKGRHFINAARYWFQPGAIKICLVVEDAATLLQLEKKYKRLCGVSIVTDSSTVFEGEPVTVCLGLGPVDPIRLENDIRNLELLV